MVITFLKNWNYEIRNLTLHIFRYHISYFLLQILQKVKENKSCFIFMFLISDKNKWLFGYMHQLLYTITSKNSMCSNYSFQASTHILSIKVLWISYLIFTCIFCYFRY